MLHDIAVVFLKPGGPYAYLRLVTAAYAVSAIGRLIPVRRKQVPGYRRHLAAAGPPGSARHRARSRRQDRPVPTRTAASAGYRSAEADPAWIPRR